MEGLRYDRQIRLWGEEGQSSIQETTGEIKWRRFIQRFHHPYLVCVLGSSALASEILKNLVLAGINRFHVIDDALVELADLGQNFFVSREDVGKPRAGVITKMLKVGRSQQ